MEPQVTVQLQERVSKKTGNTYVCLQVKVGEWDTMVFPKSTFERRYLEAALGRPVVIGGNV